MIYNSSAPANAEKIRHGIQNKLPPGVTEYAHKIVYTHIMKITNMYGALFTDYPAHVCFPANQVKHIPDIDSLEAVATKLQTA